MSAGAAIAPSLATSARAATTPPASAATTPRRSRVPPDPVDRAVPRPRSKRICAAPYVRPAPCAIGHTREAAASVPQADERDLDADRPVLAEPPRRVVGDLPRVAVRVGEGRRVAAPER